jgi:hypothetical protein
MLNYKLAKRPTSTHRCLSGDLEYWELGLTNLMSDDRRNLTEKINDLDSNQ